jgi:hypothetical protein
VLLFGGEYLGDQLGRRNVVFGDEFGSNFVQQTVEGPVLAENVLRTDRTDPIRDGSSGHVLAALPGEDAENHRQGGEGGAVPGPAALQAHRSGSIEQFPAHLDVLEATAPAEYPDRGPRPTSVIVGQARLSGH